MLSPLKPLLCRHDFYWSERHRADRCRRCGKTQAAESVEAMIPFARSAASAFRADGFVADPGHGATAGVGDLAPSDPWSPVPVNYVAHPPSAKVLKAQARERREGLLALLEQIAEGGRPTRAECLDAVLAVIEDAHSADPVLFGPDAVEHFARLHEARRTLPV